MFKKKLLVGLLMGLILSSCVTTQNIPIDQLEPGSVEIPANVRKVVVLSRNFKFTMDTLQNYFSKDGNLYRAKKAEDINVDSIAVMQSMEALQKNLSESGKFDEIVICPYTTSVPYRGEKIVPLSPQFIKRICSETNCDALISMEMISYFYLTDKADYYQELPEQASVKMNAIWAIYLPDLPENEKMLDRYTFSDNLHWEKSASTKENKDIVQIPPRLEAIQIAAGTAATKYASRLVPHWEASGRTIIVLSGTEWTDAKNLADKSKWEDAANIWKRLITSENKKQSAAAKYNYAIAAEMLGDFEAAENWAKESLSTSKSGTASRLAKDYIKYLTLRKSKIQKINSTVNPDPL